MATFVLVPGAWLGGWCWQPITPALRREKHEVYPVTLTGLGERVHLGGPQVDLDTAITHVVNLIEFEDLHDVVLVGHSFGGAPVTGVTDRIPGRIGLVVYLDSGPIPNGRAHVDLASPQGRADMERHVAEERDGWRLPMPPWEELERGGASLDGLGERERRCIRSRATGRAQTGRPCPRC